MNRSPSISLVMLALAAGVLPLAAQETIVFSKPADAKATAADSLQSDPLRRINADDYKAPKQIFNDLSPDLPLPRPVYLGNPDPAMAEAMNKRKNWTLLTPAQILGVQTPEEILGTADPKKTKLSLEDQYLLRLRTSAADGATNGRAAFIPWQDDNRTSLFGRNTLSGKEHPFDNAGNDTLPFLSGRQGNGPTPGPDRFPGDSYSAPAAAANRQPQPDSPWTSPFAQPDRPKVDDKQLAAMERFRAMIEPSAPPDKTMTPARSFNGAAHISDSFLQPSASYQSAGRPVALFENSAARPKGIEPLPGITGPAPKPDTKKPAWQAQLPPWMREGPPSR